jgi:leucyl aminopeptidase
MDVALRRGDLATRAAGAVALGILEGEKRLTGAAQAMDRAAGGAISSLIKTGDFSGRFEDVAVVYPSSGKSRRVILVGLGPAGSLDPQRVRAAAAHAASRARELRASTLATVVHGAGAGGLDPALAAQACAEGVVLGHYRHTAYRTPPTVPALKRIDIIERDAARARALAPAVARGAAWGEAACLARDLAATPGQDLTPDDLGRRAKEIGRMTGTQVRVLGVPELERLGLNGLLAVGRGSPHPPRLIVMERGMAARGKKAPPPGVVIGKGVTFDTGGISLKPRENMHKMKYDMSGAAAVLGMFHALGSIDLPFPVIGIVPTAENMPDGLAFKPGDVLRMMDGTTVEVTNTDAEGRLLLGDALCYVRRHYTPQAVVDLATLTGAISIALGPHAAGAFSEDEGLMAGLMDASAASGERLWRMPVWDEYLSSMRGDTADLVNSGPREGGACLAAAFLKHFARGLPWAHLDIASTAWSGAARGGQSAGPTGFGVRLLLTWLADRAADTAPKTRKRG